LDPDIYSLTPKRSRYSFRFIFICWTNALRSACFIAETGMALVQAIRTLTTMIREGKNTFRILLEFEEPKVG